jgi:hypothetical protein
VPCGGDRTTRKRELDRTIRNIEMWLGYVKKVYDKAYPPERIRR